MENLKLETVPLKTEGIQSFNNSVSLKNKSYSVITIDFDNKQIVKMDRFIMGEEGEVEMLYSGYWEDGEICFKHKSRTGPTSDFEETVFEINKLARFDVWEDEITEFFKK